MPRKPSELATLFRAEARQAYAERRAAAAPRAWGRRRARRKVPTIIQGTTSDCGAACLAAVLGAHGNHATLPEVRARMSIVRDGTSADAIVTAARDSGMLADGYQLDLDELKALPLPLILHWEFNHFVVLTALSGKRAEIMDPAWGRRWLPLADVGRSFTGIAISVEPGPSAVQQQAAPRSLERYRNHVARVWRTLGGILTTSVMLQALGLLLPIATVLIVDRALPGHDGSLLRLLGMGVAVFAVAHFVVSLTRARLLVRVEAQLDEDLTLSLIHHLLTLPFAFFQVRHTTDLLLRVASNSAIRQILSRRLVSLALDSVLLVSYLLVLFVKNRSLAVVAIVLALGQCVIGLLASRGLRELLASELRAQASAGGYLAEVLRGIDTVKVSAAESATFANWQRLFRLQLSLSARRQGRAALFASLGGAWSIASPATLLLVGAVGVLRGSLTLGEMLGLAALAGAFLGPLTSAVATLEDVLQVGTHLDRLNEVFDETPEQPSPGDDPGVLTGAIAFDSVEFSYSTSSSPVIRGLDLRIEPGQLIAIVGPSGAGKSTVARLLLGLYRPTRGRVLIDGRDLATLDVQRVRRQMGVVMQGGFVLADSIRGNIAFGRPDLPLADVEKAAELAGIADFIEELPMGYDTAMAEAGSTISGGQRQRLAIARAVAHGPRVILLDEATSELDAKWEAYIYGRLAALRCTRVVIAHHLHTVRNADHIVVLDKGRIVETGSDAQLRAVGGLYSSLISSAALG